MVDEIWLHITQQDGDGLGCHVTMDQPGVVGREYVFEHPLGQGDQRLSCGRLGKYEKVAIMERSPPRRVIHPRIEINFGHSRCS